MTRDKPCAGTRLLHTCALETRTTRAAVSPSRCEPWPRFGATTHCITIATMGCIRTRGRAYSSIITLLLRGPYINCVINVSLSLGVCVCVCVCLCVCVCECVCWCPPVQCVCVSSFVALEYCACLCACCGRVTFPGICVYVRLCVCVYMYVCACMCLCVRVRLCVQTIAVCFYIVSLYISESYQRELQRHA